MLTGYPGKTTVRPDADTASGWLWLDLLNPSESELVWTQRQTGVTLPSTLAGQRSRVSSRLTAQVVHLNIPGFSRENEHDSAPSPLALILTPKTLISLRFTDSAAFREALEDAQLGQADTSTAVLVSFLRGVVDRATTRMQDVSEDIGKLSHSTFSSESLRTGDLRETLLEVGRLEHRLSQLQSSLLGVARVVTFLIDAKLDWVHAEATHLHDLQRDLQVLDDFDDQLDDKLQFLLDAVLGFINTNQNDVIRFLTVVTVVTIPPIILAGIWGMNFKFMPELSWPYGYPLALGIILSSMLFPFAYCKKRSWI